MSEVIKPPTQPAKPVYASKTVIVNAVMALAALHPATSAFVSANPEVATVVAAAVNVALRFVTTRGLTWSIKIPF